MQWPALNLVARLTSSVVKTHLQPGQARNLLTGLFNQKQAKPCADRQAAHRQAYGCTWSDEYRQGHEKPSLECHRVFTTRIQLACSWMEINHEALLQNLYAEQRYAEQHFRSLQPSAALLRRSILSRVQAEEVLIHLRYSKAGTYF